MEENQEEQKSEYRGFRFPAGLFQLVEERAGKGQVTKFVIDAVFEKLVRAASDGEVVAVPRTTEVTGIDASSDPVVDDVASKEKVKKASSRTESLSRLRTSKAPADHVCIPVGTLGNKYCKRCSRSM